MNIIYINNNFYICFIKLFFKFKFKLFNKKNYFNSIIKIYNINTLFKY